MKTPKQIGFALDLTRPNNPCGIQGNMSSIPPFIQRDIASLQDGDQISIVSYDKNDHGEYVKTHKIFKLVGIKQTNKTKQYENTETKTKTGTDCTITPRRGVNHGTH